MSSTRHVARFCVLVAGVMLITACGQTKMVQTSGNIRHHMIDGNYPLALSELQKSKQQGFKEQDRVVYWMNEGMLLHLTGRYKESIAALNKAERRAKELYTKSISKGIKAAFTSNAATDYAGEDYENVLVFVVKALDFLAQGNKAGALVEARKINEKLKLYNTRYKHKNVYNQDAFAHWMMGLLFEMEGSYDDARIAYVHALEGYEGTFSPNYGIGTPKFLGEDIVRASILSNAPEEASKYKEKFGQDKGGTADLLKTHGEVVLVHLNGEGPSKSDYVVTCWFLTPTNWACDGEPGGEFMKKTRITIPSKGTVVKVAFPQLHVREPRSPQAVVGVGPSKATTSPALPISAIAVKTMADKMHRIFRDAIIRIVAKTAASKGAGAAGSAAGGSGAGGKLLGWVAEKGTSAAMQAMEEADKRAWTTLPSRIDVARVWVKPGTHTIGISLPGGRPGSIPGVKVEAGKRVVVTWYTIP
jgi:uncharacterized protein